MIKIYSAQINDYTQADYTKMYGLLECDIRQKIDAKKCEKDRFASLLGYYLLYKGAQEIYGKTGFKIRFNEHGKPLCDFCFFSISHSENRVVCAFCDFPIGIDIQKIVDVEHREKYRFFNREECFYVNQKNGFSARNYIEIFTKKEAAVKMLGLQLSSCESIDTFSEKFNFKTDFIDDFVCTVCTENV